MHCQFVSLAADLWLLSEEVAYLVDVAGSAALPGIFFMAEPRLLPAVTVVGVDQVNLLDCERS